MNYWVSILIATLVFAIAGVIGTIVPCFIRKRNLDRAFVPAAIQNRPSSHAFFLCAGLSHCVFFVCVCLVFACSLLRVIVWTAVVCMWLMWFCTYAAQVNPLGEPVIKETADDRKRE